LSYVSRLLITPWTAALVYSSYCQPSEFAIPISIAYSYMCFGIEDIGWSSFAGLLSFLLGD
jgi:hypothetical protein